MLRFLLPALIPSWRFFDRIGPSPRIEFDVGTSGDEIDAAWREVRPKPAHVSVRIMLARLFWNPRGNESLYLVSCAERLLDDPSAERAAELWARVADVIRAERAGANGPAASHLRVRIVHVIRQGGRVVRHVAFVSGARRLREFERGRDR
jgi:hypothetical protein